MLILPQIITVKWTNSNKDHYINKGYTFTKNRCPLNIDVRDLSDHSGIHVKVLCDYCFEEGKETITSPRWHDYLINKSKNNSKDCCDGCRVKKSGEAQRYSIKEIEIEFSKNDYILLSTEYEGYEKPLWFICPNGHKWHIAWGNFLHGHRCQKCAFEFNRGENASNWKGGITPENSIIRKSLDYENWRNSVFLRDDYTCVSCDTKGGSLHAHHKDAFHWNKDRRFDVNNGITLCKDCHTNFHSTFGTHDNTEEQFNKWLGEQQINKSIRQASNLSFLFDNKDRRNLNYVNNEIF